MPKYKPLRGSKKSQYNEEKDNGTYIDPITQNYVYFYNFSLPAIVTCPSAPTGCTGYKKGTKKTVCFTRSNELRWKKYKNHVEIYHYKNLLFTLENNHNRFVNFLNDPNKLNCPIHEMPSTVNTSLSGNFIDKNVDYIIDQNTCNNITQIDIPKTLSVNDFSPKKCINMNSKDFFVDNMAQLIWREFCRINSKNPSDMYMRIHHSGDFYDQEYFEKWVRIAVKLEQFKKEYKIATGSLKLMAYTKEVRMIENFLKNNTTILSTNGAPIRMLDDIHIKLVFSEMDNDIFYKTPSVDINAYNNIVSNHCRHISFIKYTVISKSNPMQTNCILDQGKGKFCYQCLGCYKENATINRVVRER